MKLRKPPYPEPKGTAAYFRIQASHRETAIDLAIEVIRDAADQEEAAASSDPVASEMTGAMRDWTIECLLQGAWIREYHMWEVDTKDYFNGHHIRNGGKTVKWDQKVSGPPPSHIAKVKDQLSQFSASVPAETIAVIDDARDKVNSAKHETGFFTTMADYKALVTAVAKFWEALDPQEEFALRG